MKTLRWLMLLGIILGGWILVPGGVAAEVVYAKSAETELREGTGLAGPIVATVDQGAALTVVEKTRMRYLVRTATGKQGWVSKLKISSDPPDTSRGFGGLIRGSDGPDEMRTAASGRGLSQGGDDLNTALVDESAINAVREMENLGEQITEDEVDRFLREGGLNA